MRTEASWSLINDKPIVLYLKNLDKHIVYWNGVGMSYAGALLIAAAYRINVYPSPKMKQVAFREFLEVYKADGFKTRDWDDSFIMDDTGSAYYSFLQRKLSPTMNNLSGHHGLEVLNMLDKKNAIRVEN